MILYFSGTGNSRFIAEKIAALTNDKAISLNKRIKSGDCSAIESKKPVVLCCPIYAWRIPRIVEEHLKATSFTGNKKLYVIVTTCGSSGNASKYAGKIADRLGFRFMGLHTLFMEGNYIAFMQYPDLNRGAILMKRAEEECKLLAETILSSKKLMPEKHRLAGRFASSILNPYFRKFIMGRKGFFASESCIACELCGRLCPTNNIHFQNNRPVWGNQCVHCMSCISYCPMETIEFRNKSQGRVRYTIEKLAEREKS